MRRLERSLSISELRPRRGFVSSLTSADDFLLGDVAGVDFGGELQDGHVGILVRVRVHVGLQGLQLLCKNLKMKGF